MGMRRRPSGEAPWSPTPRGASPRAGSRTITTDDGDARRSQPIAIFVPGASARVAVLRLAPSVVQPPPSGVFTVAAVDVLPTNTSPPVTWPEIVVFVTDSNPTTNSAPVDVFPLFHLTVTLAVLGF
jgi:hypothetical protein